MTDHDDDRTPDDALLARLRAGDPAAHLRPADPDRVARLLEDAMSHDLTTESRETGARDRSPLTWLVAAAAVVLIAAAGAFALLDRGDQQPPLPTAGDRQSATELAMPEASAARCMVPNAGVLGHAAYALDGEVVSIADGVVTLDVSRWYAGEGAGQVTVDQSSADRQALIGAPVFEPGQRYLVAATGDRQVMVCGYSDQWSEQLAALYDRAFGAPPE